MPGFEGNYEKSLERDALKSHEIPRVDSSKPREEKKVSFLDPAERAADRIAAAERESGEPIVPFEELNRRFGKDADSAADRWTQAEVRAIETEIADTKNKLNELRKSLGLSESNEEPPSVKRLRDRLSQLQN